MVNSLIAVLLAAAPAAAPTPPSAPDWRTYAECSAAHYAAAQIIDLQRTAPMKAAIIDVGRRYAKAAFELRHEATGDGKDKAASYAKAYILQRTQLLATHTRPEVKAMIAGCPKL